MVGVIIVCLLLVFLLVFIKNLKHGIPIVVFLIPFDRIGTFSLQGHVVRPVQIAGLAMILAWLISLARQKIKIRHIKGIGWLSLFAISVLCSTVIANQYFIWKDFGSALFEMAIFFVVAQLTQKHSLQLITKALFASLATMAAVGLYQFIGGALGVPHSIIGLSEGYSRVVFGFPRVQSTVAEPLFLANFLLLPLFIGLAVKNSTVLKQQYKYVGAVLAFGLLTFFLTFSKGAFIGFTAGLALFAWLTRKELGGSIKKLVALPVILLLISFILISAASFLYTKDALVGPRNIIGSATSIGQTGSFIERRGSFIKAYETFKERPLLGLGIGGYSFLHTGGTGRVAVNNEPLEILVETGLVGFVFYVLFLGSLLKNALISVRLESLIGDKFLLAGLLAAIVASLIQFQFFSGFFITPIWISWGLLAGLVSGPEPYKFNFKNLKHLLN